MYGAAVIFLDEIDTVGSRGGVSQYTRARRWLVTLWAYGRPKWAYSVLVVQMDGFSSEPAGGPSWRARFYKLILRRNVPKPERRVAGHWCHQSCRSLDPALLRPGRFDKKLRVDAPDMQGRIDIFKYYLQENGNTTTVWFRQCWQPKPPATHQPTSNIC